MYFDLSENLQKLAVCTLSIFKSNINKTIITMNRDEVRGRAEAENIHTKNNIIYPIDKKSGGTWFGFNHHGIIMALLNRYQDEYTDAKLSRGILIPQLLLYKNSRKIYNSLNHMYLEDFNPFDLILIEQNKIIKFSWNGKQLSQTQVADHSPYLLSSSSVDAKNILAYRKQAFNEYTTQYSGKKANHILSDLHLVQNKYDTSSSIFMSRIKTHTKSISQVVIDVNSLNYCYIQEQDLKNIDRYSPLKKCQHVQLNLS